MEKHFAVYMMASQRNGTLYIGVTSNLPKRVWEHREGVVAGFTSEYHVKSLVWYELHDDAEAAILREKQIKKWNRGATCSRRFAENRYARWGGWIPACAGMTATPAGEAGFPPARE
jgi:putative endonuclease